MEGVKLVFQHRIKKTTYLVIGILMMIAFLSSINGRSSVAVEADQSDEETEFAEHDISVRDDLYSNYLELYQDYPRPDQEVIVRSEDYTKTEDMKVEIIEKDGVTGVATEEVGTIHWEVDIPEEGMYNIGIKYYPIEGKSSSIERELLINGETPFQGAATLTFPRIWTNESNEIERDNRGNDLRPKQVESPLWNEVAFQDAEGYYIEPYLFHFKKGVNTISLVSSREPMLIDFIKIYQNKEIPSYDELQKTYDELGYQPSSGQLIKVQGEDATFKSDPTLYAVNDRSSPATEPYDVSKIRMNAIGGYNWRWPGQWITWEVEVPEDGLYVIGIKNKQDTLRGVVSTRKVTINNEMPFKELEKVTFNYDNNWKMDVLGDEEPYLVYLKEGINEIRMEVTLGDLAPLLRTVESSVLDLNHMYRKILMITGPTPDPYRDYELDKRIPEMTEVFARQSEILKDVANKMVELTGETGDQTAMLKTMSNQLDDFVKRPETIQRRLDSFKINVGGLGTWILTVREQPLTIDYINVASPDQEMPKAEAS